MRFVTLLGLLGAIAVVLFAMTSGSDYAIFLNPPSAMIVIGGTLAATLIKFPINHCFRAIRVAFRAFRDDPERPEELIRRANELTGLVRKKGLLGIDGEQVRSPFFQKGLQLAIDGRSPEFVRKVLDEEMHQAVARNETSQGIFRAVGDSAPAFGMIGTLVGLVQMLTNMQDLDALGPGMALALLTTLYGALFAHLIAIPIADKLELRGNQERVNMMLITESVLAIQAGQNAQLMDEVLTSYLPHNEREQLLEEVARHRSDFASDAAEQA